MLRASHATQNAFISLVFVGCNAVLRLCLAANLAAVECRKEHTIYNTCEGKRLAGRVGEDRTALVPKMDQQYTLRQETKS